MDPHNHDLTQEVMRTVVAELAVEFEVSRLAKIFTFVGIKAIHIKPWLLHSSTSSEKYFAKNHYSEKNKEDCSETVELKNNINAHDQKNIVREWIVKQHFRTHHNICINPLSSGWYINTAELPVSTTFFGRLLSTGSCLERCSVSMSCVQVKTMNTTTAVGSKNKDYRRYIRKPTDNFIA